MLSTAASELATVKLNLARSTLARRLAKNC